MSISSTLPPEPTQETKTADDVGTRGRVLLLIVLFWWLFAYFFLGWRLRDTWWLRDLLASAPLILLCWFAPSRIRGLAVCGSLWWLIAHLTHDLVFTRYYPGADTPFATELMLWIMTWVPAALAGAFIVAALILPHVYFASEFVLAFRGVFGFSRREAMKALLTVSFGLQLPYAIIENGQETITKPKGMLDKIGGPGLVIIRPANAVVYERLGKITQIVGPGRASTKLFEFKKGIVQLRPRWVNFAADDVMTGDGVALKVVGGLSAQIEPADRTKERIEAANKKGESYQWAWRTPECRDRIAGDFPVYKDSVFRAVYRPAGENWEQTLSGAAIAVVREVVGKRRLEDIFGDPSEGITAGQERFTDVLEQEARSRLNSWIHEWGLQVGTVGISVLTPPEEVQQKVRARWRTAAERANIEQISEAEAGALRVLEATKKNSFDEMSRALQSAMQRLAHTYGDDAPLRFQETLQIIAANVGRDNMTTLRYIEALEKLSNHPNAHIIIAPGSQSINIGQPE